MGVPKPGCLQFLRGSALLHSFAYLGLCAFAVICVLLCSFASFCVRLRFGIADIRERELNTNLYFLKLFGHPRDIPAKSRDIPPKNLVSLVSKDIPNFWPPPLHVQNPPPHPKISGPKSLGLGSFFLPEI